MRQAADFPYYNGQPVAISPLGWLLVVAATALGFYLLVAPFTHFGPFPVTLLPAILFVALPLVALRFAAGAHWTALFHRYGPLQWALSLGFAVLTMVASAVVALLFVRLMPGAAAANPAMQEIAAGGPLAFAAFLSATFIQLIGEELVTILPLLAILWLCVSVFKLPRAWALVIAVVVSTLWFAALHLPTYNWNFLQCLLIIGTARLVLTAAYLVTRNLWVSAGAHIINDWAGFFFAFFASHAALTT